MMFGDALTEQEAFGLESLDYCVRKHLPRDFPFWEARAFASDNEEDMYTGEHGGNYCTYLQGLLQIYLPGVAASIQNAFQQAYDMGDLANDPDYAQYPPVTLGVRTAEFLQYKRTGKLGLHTDTGSVYSISIAMSHENEYRGGYFQLYSGSALFKAPRRSAIVFFSEKDHGVTRVTAGERKVFVIELWDDEDVPVGVQRPSQEDFEHYKRGRGDRYFPDQDSEGEEF